MTRISNRHSMILLSVIQFSLLLVQCGAVAVAAALPDTGVLLDKMADAMRSRNYDGTFIYQRGEQTDTMRIIHVAGPNGERERLVSLTGPAREVLRDASGVTCIFSDEKAVLVGNSHHHRQLFPADLRGSASTLAGHYDFALEGSDRIAGKNTWIVAITPKGPYRYGYRLWIDKDTHLLLGSHILDREHQLLEQILFTRMEIPDAISADLLKPGIGGPEYTWYTNKKSVTEDLGRSVARWKATWLPVGFTMREQEISASVSAVSHTVYTDGLAMISVFVEELDEQEEQLRGFFTKGAVSTYSTVSGGHQVTVMGEVPPAAVQQIAISVRSVTSP